MQGKGGAMRFYGVVLAAAAVLALSGRSAQAQTFQSVPIDANKLVVKPADTTTNIIGNSVKVVSRVAAGYVSNNAMVRTVNNLLGKKQDAMPLQAGPSG